MELNLKASSIEIELKAKGSIRTRTATCLSVVRKLEDSRMGDYKVKANVYSLIGTSIRAGLWMANLKSRAKCSTNISM